MDHQPPPPPKPPHPQPELPLVPAKRRRRSSRTTSRRSPSSRNPTTAAAAVAHPPPPAARRVPPFRPSFRRRRQIPAPPAATEAADACNHELMLLADTAVAQADAEAEARAQAQALLSHLSHLSYYHPAPAPEHENAKLIPSSSSSSSSAAAALLPPPAAAADEEEYEEEKPKPYALLPPPPPVVPPLAAAVDHKNPLSLSLSLSMGHGDDAAGSSKGAAGGDDCKKSACWFQVNDGAGSSSNSNKGDELAGGVALPAAGASLSLPQLGEEDEELEFGEIPPEKQADGCNNADPAHEIDGSLPGKEEETAVGVVSTAGVAVGRDNDNDEAAAAAEVSAADQKRKREVFVGGLSRDATEEDDVRAALSVAGEITQVRMIMDRATSNKQKQNKGYCFVAYRDAAMASRAVGEFRNVKICGKPCRVAVPQGNENNNKTSQKYPIIEYYNSIYEQGQPSPTRADHSTYITSWDPYARYDNNTYAIPASSYAASPVVAFPAGYYIPMYHNGNSMYLPTPDLNYGQGGPSRRNQMGKSGSCRPARKPHRRGN